MSNPADCNCSTNGQYSFASWYYSLFTVMFAGDLILQQDKLLYHLPQLCNTQQYRRTHSYCKPQVAVFYLGLSFS